VCVNNHLVNCCPSGQTNKEHSLGIADRLSHFLFKGRLHFSRRLPAACTRLWDASRTGAELEMKSETRHQETPEISSPGRPEAAKRKGTEYRQLFRQRHGPLAKKRMKNIPQQMEDCLLLILSSLLFPIHTQKCSPN